MAKLSTHGLLIHSLHSNILQTIRVSTSNCSTRWSWAFCYQGESIQNNTQRGTGGCAHPEHSSHASPSPPHVDVTANHVENIGRSPGGSTSLLSSGHRATTCLGLFTWLEFLSFCSFLTSPLLYNCSSGHARYIHTYQDFAICPTWYRCGVQRNPMRKRMGRMDRPPPEILMEVADLHPRGGSMSAERRTRGHAFFLLSHAHRTSMATSTPTTQQ